MVVCSKKTIDNDGYLQQVTIFENLFLINNLNLEYLKIFFLFNLSSIWSSLLTLKNIKIAPMGNKLLEKIYFKILKINTQFLIKISKINLSNIREQSFFYIGKKYFKF